MKDTTEALGWKTVNGATVKLSTGSLVSKNHSSRS